MPQRVRILCFFLTALSVWGTPRLRTQYFPNSDPFASHNASVFVGDTLVVACGSSGLSWYDTQSGATGRITSSDGLPGNNVRGLHVSPSGELFAFIKNSDNTSDMTLARRTDSGWVDETMIYGFDLFGESMAITDDGTRYYYARQGGSADNYILRQRGENGAVWRSTGHTYSFAPIEHQPIVVQDGPEHRIWTQHQAGEVCLHTDTQVFNCFNQRTFFAPGDTMSTAGSAGLTGGRKGRPLVVSVYYPTRSLWSYNAEQNSFRQWPVAIPRYSRGPLHLDGRGWVWMSGSPNGVILIDSNAMTAKMVLDTQRVTSFAEHSSGSVWVVSRGVIYRSQGDDFESATMVEVARLPSLLWTPSPASVDNLGVVWLGGDHYFNGQGLVARYGLGDGSRVQMPDGTLLRARKSGVYYSGPVASRGGHFLWEDTLGAPAFVLDDGAIFCIWKGVMLRKCGIDGGAEDLVDVAEINRRVDNPSGDKYMFMRLRDGSIMARVSPNADSVLVIDQTGHYSYRSLLPGRKVNGIAQDSLGFFWLVSGQELFRWHASTGAVSMPVPAQWSSSRTCYFSGVTADRFGQVWISGCGVFRLNSDWTWDSFQRTDGIPNYLVRNIFADPQGDIWLGTWNLGTARIISDSSRVNYDRLALPPDYATPVADVPTIRQSPPFNTVPPFGSLHVLVAGVPHPSWVAVQGRTLSGRPVPAGYVGVVVRIGEL